MDMAGDHLPVHRSAYDVGRIAGGLKGLSGAGDPRLQGLQSLHLTAVPEVSDSPGDPISREKVRQWGRGPPHLCSHSASFLGRSGAEGTGAAAGADCEANGMASAGVIESLSGAHGMAAVPCNGSLVQEVGDVSQAKAKAKAVSFL
jgi:hypothetical protein